MHLDGASDLKSLAEQVAALVAAQIAERLATTGTQRFFTVQDAAEFSGLSADSIRAMLAAGKLHGLRPVPGRVLIDRRELEAVILASTSRPRTRRGQYDRELAARRRAERTNGQPAAEN